MKGRYNDIWGYSESEGWVWIDGSDAVNQQSKYTGNNTHPGGRFYPIMWIDQNNTIWIFGGEGSNGNMNDLWAYTFPSTSIETNETLGRSSETFPNNIYSNSKIGFFINNLIFSFFWSSNSFYWNIFLSLSYFNFNCYSYLR